MWGTRPQTPHITTTSQQRRKPLLSNSTATHDAFASVRAFASRVGSHRHPHKRRKSQPLPSAVGSYTVLMCPPPCSSCEPPTSAASSALDRHVERHVERHAAPGASCRAPRALWTVAPMALSVPSHPSQSLPNQERRARLPIGARHDAPDEATHLVIDMTLPTKPPGGGTRNTQSRYVPECPGAVSGRSSRRSTHAFCAFFLPAIR